MNATVHCTVSRVLVNVQTYQFLGPCSQWPLIYKVEKITGHESASVLCPWMGEFLASTFHVIH